MKPGFHMHVLPGLHLLNGPQRETLLKLGEYEQLKSPIKLRRINGTVLAVDRRGRSWTLYPDGTAHTTPPR